MSQSEFNPVDPSSAAGSASAEGYEASEPSYPTYDTANPATVEANPDSWPLEADRVAIRSPLVESLRILAGHYGRRTSENSLLAGLPIPATGITPSLFERAAARADLNAKMIERTLEALAIAPNLPCILVLEHKQACIL
jgi:ATP-binding cassette subfamily C protein LapB